MKFIDEFQLLRFRNSATVLKNRFSTDPTAIGKNDCTLYKFYIIYICYVNRKRRKINEEFAARVVTNRENYVFSIRLLRAKR